MRFLFQVSIYYLILAAVSGESFFSQINKSKKEKPIYTIVAPKYIHSERNYGFFINFENLEQPIVLKCSITGQNFSNIKIIEFNENGGQKITFDIPEGQDEYLLTIEDEKDIKEIIELQYAEYKRIVEIITDNTIYVDSTEIIYKIFVFDENLRPREFRKGIDIVIYDAGGNMVDKHENVHNFFYYLLKIKPNMTFGEFHMQAKYNNNILREVTFDVWSTEALVNERKKRETNNTKIEIENQTEIPQTRLDIEKISDSDDLKIEILEAVEKLPLKANETIPLTVTSKTPFLTLVYVVIARGEVLFGKRIELKEKTTLYKINFNSTNYMAPYFRIIISFLDDENKLHYAEAEFEVEPELENEIKIQCPSETRPNKTFNLKIEAELEMLAQIEIVEIDSINPNFDYDMDLAYMLSSIGGIDLKSDELTGSVLRTNDNNFIQEDQKYLKSYTTKSNLKRRTKRDPIKRNPTSWMPVTSGFTVYVESPVKNYGLMAISAIAFHPELGLGFARNILKVRECYSVNIHSLSAIKIGEIFKVHLSIQNIIDEMQTLRLSWEKEHRTNCEFLNIETKAYNKESITPPKSFLNETFFVRCTSPGEQEIFFYISSDKYADRKSLIINVDQSSPRYSTQRSFLVTEGKRDYYIKRPSTLIPYSEKLKLRFFEGVLSPIYHNMLKKNVFGDNIEEITAALSIWTQIYQLQKKFHEHSDTTSKILATMQKLYKELLRFREPQDGSFLYFKNFKYDKSQIIVNTAHVLQVLAKLKNIISPSDFELEEYDKVMKEGLEYLITQQILLQHEHFREGRQNVLPITAQILLAFLSNKEYRILYANEIQRSINFLIFELDTIDDVYAKAVATYALSVAGHPKTLHLLDKLLVRSRSNDNYLWLVIDDTENTETNIYLLLTMLETKDDDDNKSVLKIYRWIVEKTDILSSTGFYPNYVISAFVDAVVAHYSETHTYYNYQETYMNFNYEMRTYYGKIVENSVGLLKSFDKFEKELDLQTYLVEGNLRSPEIRVLQLITDCEVTDEERKETFNVVVDVINKDSSTPILNLELNVCVTYIGWNDKEGLSVLEIMLPSGYSADNTKLETIQNISDVHRLSTSEFNNSIRIYFQNIQFNKKICLPIWAKRSWDVGMQAKVPVIAYQINDIKRAGKAFYSIPSNECDVCGKSENCLGNYKKCD